MSQSGATKNGLREGEGFVTIQETQEITSLTWGTDFGKRRDPLKKYAKVGFVYFVQVGTTGPIKIGFTKNEPTMRIRQIQDTSPHKLRWIGYLRGPLSKEGELHKQFAEEWMRGEWFRPSERLLCFIRDSCPQFEGKTAYDCLFHTDLIQQIKSAVGLKHESIRHWEDCIQECGIHERVKFWRWLSREIIPTEEMVENTRRAFELFLRRKERAAA
jgi:hypothetical protein